MKQKHYTVIRVCISMVLTAFVVMITMQKQYLLAIPAMAIAMLAMLFLRRRVSEVIADERDIAVGGIAARLAMTIFALLATLAMFTLLALQDVHPLYEPIGYTLGMSSCVLLITYSLCFRFLRDAQ